MWLCLCYCSLCSRVFCVLGVVGLFWVCLGLLIGLCSLWCWVVCLLFVVVCGLLCLFMWVLRLIVLICLVLLCCIGFCLCLVYISLGRFGVVVFYCCCVGLMVDCVLCSDDSGLTRVVGVLL